ncbi:ribosome-inactivating family protein [Streptomyces sp. NPDC049813]|uniref:ribosome-inactivating family protein n=1 Tax=Streptomyces sp. NPDC049813 TaxID=3365597 RepID=UPI0037924402
MVTLNYRISQGIPALPRKLLSLLVAFIAGISVLTFNAGAAHADTPEYRISHVYANLSEPWANPGRVSGDWGRFLQSLRNAVGHYYSGESSITQNIQTYPHSLVRADVNVQNAEGHQASLRLWFTPNNLYLRGFTTTSVDASSSSNGDVTYYFNDYDLPDRMNGLRAYSPDRGLLPPANYVRLPYGGSYPALERPVSSGGPGVSRDNTEMSYTQFYNSVFHLAYVPAGTTQNNGTNFRTTAASLMRMIQATSEAARLRDVQGIIIQMMANHGYTFTMPALQQELETDWGSLSEYAYTGTDSPGHNVGPHVPYVTTVARALGYLAILLAPYQGSGA